MNEARTRTATAKLCTTTKDTLTPESSIGMYNAILATTLAISLHSFYYNGRLSACIYLSQNFLRHFPRKMFRSGRVSKTQFTWHLLLKKPNKHQHLVAPLFEWQDVGSFFKQADLTIADLILTRNSINDSFLFGRISSSSGILTNVNRS